MPGINMTTTESKKLKKRVREIDIQFKDLVYQVDVPKQKEKKAVLKNVSGTFKSGQLTAIMGPSGAGKSSLLNVLTGFAKKGVTGTVSYGDATKARKFCCYIMQEDHFYSWFTVEETMMFAATLKISNNSMNIKEKRMLIEQILGTLKLTQAKATKCGKLSGGQKKRLSIALELIDNPSVLFLDEPTTGLDSSTSFDMIQLLRELANDKRTIVCTIHQPSANIYNLFNQIYVMSQGHCAFRGTPGNTMKFLKTIDLECPAYHNPADFLLECVNGDYGDHIESLTELAKNAQWLSDECDDENDESLSDVRVLKMAEAKGNAATTDSSTTAATKLRTTTSNISMKHTYPPPEWVRLWMLIGRCHMQFFRDWTVTYLKLVIHIACAILIGLFYGDSGSNATKQVSNLSSFIIHCVYLWYTTMMPGVLRFPQEINIIKKETFNSWYKLKTLYLATLITSTPVHIIFATVYTSIAYFLTSQPFEVDRFVKFMLTAVVVTICADGLGILLGTLLNPINGTFIGAVLTCFMLIFSGFLILLTHMSKVMRVISYFSPIRYALESMVLSIYSNNRANTNCPANVMYCHFKSPVTLLRTFGMENSNYGFNILMILLQLTIFKSLAYITLKRKLNL